jgi:antitoxin HicB
MMKAKNIGSGFDDFLQEEGILDEENAVAIKRVIAWQIDQKMNAQKLTKSAVAKKCAPAAPP